MAKTTSLRAQQLKLYHNAYFTGYWLPTSRTIIKEQPLQTSAPRPRNLLATALEGMEVQFHAFLNSATERERSVSRGGGGSAGEKYPVLTGYDVVLAPHKPEAMGNRQASVAVGNLTPIFQPLY